jgi:hypothetical protein
MDITSKLLELGKAASQKYEEFVIEENGPLTALWNRICKTIMSTNDDIKSPYVRVYELNASDAMYADLDGSVAKFRFISSSQAWVENYLNQQLQTTMGEKFASNYKFHVNISGGSIEIDLHLL